MTINDLMLSRRQVLGLGAAAMATFGLVACDSEEAPAPSGDDSSEEATEEVKLDVTAYDELVASGPVADDETIAANAWATAIKDAGVLRVGGVQTSMLFSLLNEEDGRTRGFDAGLSQLLARYIIGDDTKTELTLDYAVGDNVQITGGPLEGFVGVVDEIDLQAQKVKVKVSMFGRETPAELELGQAKPL